MSSTLRKIYYYANAFIQIAIGIDKPRTDRRERGKESGCRYHQRDRSFKQPVLGSIPMLVFGCIKAGFYDKSIIGKLLTSSTRLSRDHYRVCLSSLSSAFCLFHLFHIAASSVSPASPASPVSSVSAVSAVSAGSSVSFVSFVSLVSSVYSHSSVSSASSASSASSVSSFFASILKNCITNMPKFTEGMRRLPKMCRNFEKYIEKNLIV